MHPPAPGGDGQPPARVANPYVYGGRHAPPLTPPPPGQPVPEASAPLGVASLVCAILSLILAPFILTVVALIQAAREARVLRAYGGTRGDKLRIRAARMVAVGGVALWLALIPVSDALNHLLTQRGLVRDPVADTPATVVGAYQGLAEDGVGTCFDHPQVPETVDCAGPHDGEVTGVAPVPAGPYPGEARMEALGQAACDEYGRAYVGGKAKGGAGYGFGHVHPTATMWADGDHGILCLLLAGEGRRLTGSHWIEAPGNLKRPP
jgi:Septum formation